MSPQWFPEAFLLLVGAMLPPFPLQCSQQSPAKSQLLLPLNFSKGMTIEVRRKAVLHQIDSVFPQVDLLLSPDALSMY